MTQTSQTPSAAIPVTLEEAPLGSAPEQEPLGGLPARRLQVGSVLAWPALDEPALLDLVVGCDLRADCRLQLVADDGQAFALDAGFASHAQHLRLRVPAGLGRLRVQDVAGEGQLWLLAETLAPRVWPATAAPALRRQRTLERLREDALCQFSWMGGCVLEGLQALERAEPGQGWAEARQRWLAHYLRPDGLRYQDPRGRPTADRFYGIEGTLPVAGIAAADPQHPVCALALDLWRRCTQPDGTITDHSATAEGSYTIAYPLAVIARGRDDTALRALALQQLHRRRARLLVDGDIHLRHDPEHGHSFRNWARGLTWYLLGLARCLETLGVDSDPELAEHLAERCAWIVSRQRADGLWDNFLDEPGFPPDSSGSSGLATTLLLARRLGLADAAAAHAAERCWQGLGGLLEPDGWLGSVAPNNKRGEAEQHVSRRTVEPFALGLYAQLAAERRLAGM